MDGPALISALKDDAHLWARAFHQHAVKLGYSTMDMGWLIGWFANAIEGSSDHRTRALKQRSDNGQVQER
jgi:hypothetical protein